MLNNTVLNVTFITEFEKFNNSLDFDREKQHSLYCAHYKLSYARFFEKVTKRLSKMK